MFSSQNIKQIATDPPSVYAFRIEGSATSAEMADMAKLLDEAFNRYDKINMLLFLHHYSPADAILSLSLKSLATQARSVAHVDRYAVVGPPPSAAHMIEGLSTVSPIFARTFEPSEADAAWTFVGARPAP